MKEIIIGENRDFKGVWINQQIYRDNNLTRTERDCLIEIISLCNQGNCFATNKHFAEYLGIAKGTAANIIYSLRKKGYIKINLVYKQGSKEIEKRVIEYLDPYSQKNEYPIHSKMNTPIHEKMKEKNTILKNTEEENTNKDNQEWCSEKSNTTGDVISFPDIELNNNQWHWRNDKQYKDYIEKIMPKYICVIVHERNYRGKDADTAIHVLTKVISIFYHRYRINKGEYHPWYTKEMLNECITEMFEYGLSEKGQDHISIDIATEYIDQFFSHEKMDSDYHLKAFSTQGMLKVLGAELGYDEWEEYN